MKLTAVALVTVIAGLVGFGIGFSAGFWTGPGAFISGVMTGNAAAIAVVSTSASLGLLSGGITFFHKDKNTSKAVQVLDQFTHSVSIT